MGLGISLILLFLLLLPSTNRCIRPIGKMVGLQIPGNNISYHLSDRALPPLLSSTASQAQPASSISPADEQMQALTTVAINAYNSAARLGLGIPQRIMIESRHRGPVILHSYINPPVKHKPLPNGTGQGIFEQAREELRLLSSSTEQGTIDAEEQEDLSEALVNGAAPTEEVQEGASEALVNGAAPTEVQDESSEDEYSSVSQPPLLIASVIAHSATDTTSARKAAAKLERVGRNFQQEWTREQLETDETAVVSHNEET